MSKASILGMLNVIQSKIYTLPYQMTESDSFSVRTLNDSKKLKSTTWNSAHLGMATFTSTLLRRGHARSKFFRFWVIAEAWKKVSPTLSQIDSSFGATHPGEYSSQLGEYVLTFRGLAFTFDSQGEPGPNSLVKKCIVLISLCNMPKKRWNIWRRFHCNF